MANEKKNKMQTIMQYNTQNFISREKQNQNINSCHHWVVYTMANYYFLLWKFLFSKCSKMSTYDF